MLRLQSGEVRYQILCRVGVSTVTYQVEVVWDVLSPIVVADVRIDQGNDVDRRNWDCKQDTHSRYLRQVLGSLLPESVEWAWLYFFTSRLLNF